MCCFVPCSSRYIKKKKKKKKNEIFFFFYQGMFILGNAEMLSEHNSLWNKVIAQLKKEQCVDSALPLACQNHPQKLTLVRIGADFRFVEDGKKIIMIHFYFFFF